MLIHKQRERQPIIAKERCGRKNTSAKETWRRTATSMFKPVMQANQRGVTEQTANEQPTSIRRRKQRQQRSNKRQTQQRGNTPGNVNGNRATARTRKRQRIRRCASNVNASRINHNQPAITFRNNATAANNTAERVNQQNATQINRTMS